MLKVATEEPCKGQVPFPIPAEGQLLEGVAAVLWRPRRTHTSVGFCGRFIPISMGVFPPIDAELEDAMQALGLEDQLGTLNYRSMYDDQVAA